MIPSILCYVPPSVECSAPKTPQFSTKTHDPPTVFKPGPTPLKFLNQIDVPGLQMHSRELYGNSLASLMNLDNVEHQL